MLATTDKKTDWDSYYQNPSTFSKFTRKTTERLLLNHLKKTNPLSSICELGGANSCFFPAIRKAHPQVQYTIIDNNQQGMDLFRKNYSDSNVDLHLQDLSSTNPNPTLHDFVFSIGLIEHFSPEDTATVIKNHFLFAKPKGKVIMTFPTPTWLYKQTRSVIEGLGLWIFHDERPLSLKEVIQDAQPYGLLKECYINWGTILTQGVVVFENQD